MSPIKGGGQLIEAVNDCCYLPTTTKQITGNTIDFKNSLTKDCFSLITARSSCRSIGGDNLKIKLVNPIS